MPETHSLAQFETPVIAQEDADLRLEEAFWSLEGFENFRKITMPSLDQDVQDSLITVFLGHVIDEAFWGDLDSFSGDGFPADAYSARSLIEKYPLNAGLSEALAVNAKIKEAVQTEQVENREKLSEAHGNIAALSGALEPLGIDLTSELETSGVNLNAEGGVAAFLTFLDANADRYLAAASARSPWSLIAVFEAVQPFAKQSPRLTAILERHQVDYQLAQDFLTQPDRRLIDIQDARAALGGSAIVAINGNVIRGSDGEKLDLSSKTMRLSLEGAGGLELDIGTIDRPKTRRTSLEIGRKQLSIQSKEADIAKLSAKSEQITVLMDQLKLETRDSFASDEGRAWLIRGLLMQFPDMVGLAGKMETFDTGAEFLKGLIAYLSKAQNHAESRVTISRAEITTLRRDIGRLQAQIDTKRGLAAEKLRTRKERVLATRAFYDRLWVSEALGGLQEVFARISPSNPLNLSDGTTVSGINLATLRISSTRTPGEGGPSDMRCQKLFAEIFNTALTGGQHEPIVFTEGGRIMYQKNGQVIDRARFTAQVAAQAGDLAFRSKVIARLFNHPE